MDENCGISPVHGRGERSGTAGCQTVSLESRDRGPGQRVDTEITEQAADQRLAWTSRGSAIKSWVVTFHQLSNARSNIMLQLEYDSQGVAEHGGEALGVVSSRVQGDLERFKAFIEKRWRPPGQRHNLR